MFIEDIALFVVLVTQRFSSLRSIVSYVIEYFNLRLIEEGEGFTFG
jgi:hypothetical protein